MNQPKDYVPAAPLNGLTGQQTMWESILETAINIASGFLVSYLVFLFVIPIFWPEHASSYGTAFGVVMVFTVTSFLRSLIWRRFFNAELHKAIHRLVKKL